MSEWCLTDLAACFQGAVPASLVTVARDGMPNCSFVSHVYLIDDTHVAVSAQFLNKTRRNLDQNPRALIQMLDPATLHSYLVDVLFQRSETSGPLFDAMALRLDAIAALEGMSNVFRLQSADVFEVLAIRKMGDEFRVLPALAPPPRQSLRQEAFSDLRTLQAITERINQSDDLEGLLDAILSAMQDCFGFAHTMILLPDESRTKFHVVASRGHDPSPVGAEVGMGEGLIGAVAQAKRPLRFSGLAREVVYARAIRNALRLEGLSAEICTIPLPRLPGAQCHLAVPLLVRQRLVGILAVDSAVYLDFTEDDELFLGVLGNHLALALQNILLRAPEPEDDPAEPAPPAAPASSRQPAGPVRTFRLYPRDECVLVDGEYLIRNLPARILWRILSAHVHHGRTEFTNRELRLDASLDLPAYKDNLESRLLLLRKRLEAKCPDVRMLPSGRGRFVLDVTCHVRLEAALPT